MTKITLDLTPLEARGVLALLAEGREGLLTDDAAALGYIGNKRAVDAATSGTDKLEAELRRIA